MVKEVEIKGVRCRNVKGKIEYKIPTSMNGQQFMNWKQHNKDAVLKALKM